MSSAISCKMPAPRSSLFALRAPFGSRCWISKSYAPRQATLTPRRGRTHISTTPGQMFSRRALNRWLRQRCRGARNRGASGPLGQRRRSCHFHRRHSSSLPSDPESATPSRRFLCACASHKACGGSSARVCLLTRALSRSLALSYTHMSLGFASHPTISRLAPALSKARCLRGSRPANCANTAWQAWPLECPCASQGAPFQRMHHRVVCGCAKLGPLCVSMLR